MLKTRSWAVIIGFLIAGVWSYAQTEPSLPSDDGKEPKTLAKVVADNPQGLPLAAAAAGPETNYQPETSYRPGMAPPGQAPGAPEVRTTTVSREVGGVRVQGLLAELPSPRPKAAVLLLPEWWGLNDAIKAEASWWARNGYKALAFDLYGGPVARDRGQAARLMAGLKAETLLPRLKAALTLLAEPGDKKTTASLPVVVIGFGVGGVWAQRLAAEDPRPAALVNFYGEPLRDAALLAKIKAPALGIFAGRDAWVTPEKIDAFKKGMTGAKLPPRTLSLMAQPGFLFDSSDPVNRNYADTARQQALSFVNREVGD